MRICVFHPAAGFHKGRLLYGLDRARPVLGIVGGSLGASALILAVALAAATVWGAGNDVSTDLSEFRDELPKSNVGKILRRELRDEELAKLG